MLAPRRAFQVLGAMAVISGCTSEKPAPPPVFGGQGAVIGSPKEMALPSEEGGTKAAGGPCANGSPASEISLVDDFEDGDAKIFKAFQREGWWFVATDNTEGSKVSPSGNNFAPEKLPPGQGAKSNLFAAHFTAQGQTQWGASLGTSFRWVNEGIRCPFNASHFAGLKFRAKGPGVIRVWFGIPETIPPENGGTCSKGCYDAHTSIVMLSDRWDDYFVRWDRLQQNGFGTEAHFDPSRLLGVTFAVSTKELPADFWIDDLELVPPADMSRLIAAAAAAPAPVSSVAPASSATPTKAKLPKAK
jgi:hypothetical protein